MSDPVYTNPDNYIYNLIVEPSETQSDIGEINGRPVKLIDGIKIVGGLGAVIVASLALCGLLQLHHYIPNDATWLTNIGEPGLWSMLLGAIVVEGGIIKALESPSVPFDNENWEIIEDDSLHVSAGQNGFIGEVGDFDAFINNEGEGLDE